MTQQITVTQLQNGRYLLIAGQGFTITLTRLEATELRDRITDALRRSKLT